MTKPSTINLVARTNPDGTPFYENVLVEELGSGRYRVLATPGLLEGFAGGDEIELAPGNETGGNIGVQFFCRGNESRCVEDLEPKVNALGGCLDGESPGLLVFTIPVAAGFPAIEKIFYDAELQYP